MESPLHEKISLSDVVRSKSCGKIGIVTEAADGPDWYDSSLLSPDQIEVQWDYDTDRKCVNRNDVTVISRFLCHGTVVASALDPSGQCGVVTNVDLSVDLLTPDGTIMEGVDTRELIHVKDFIPYNFVVFGPWIGKIDDVIENVTVLFDNGSVCEFIEADVMSLIPIDNVTKIHRVCYPGYFPGQRVKAEFLSVCHKNPRFLSGLWRPKSLEGTVTKVSVKSVYVQWIAYIGCGGDGCPTNPDEKQSPENLKLLPHFPQALWLCFENCRLNNVEGVFKITNVKKKVDVTWQDGTTEKELDSSTLISKQETPSLFFPLQFVRMINTQEDEEIGRSGFIKSSDSKEKTALVSWQKGGVDEGEREVSIYEIEIHPKRKYFYGDLVGLLPHYTSGDVIVPSRVGIVIGMENCLINVSWLSGTDSKVVPEDIFEIETRYFDDVYNLESKESKTFVEKFLSLVDAVAIYGMRLLNTRLWTINHFIPFLSKFICEENEGRSQRILCCSSSKSFEVTEDHSDHYFVHAEGQSNAQRKWLKKVQEDWRILQNNLPDGIFVRVYEDRMDLLRAMIVGPYGTPYQDGLFFFDFHLPPEYPDVPPVVHYHSGGWKINPNLYEDGKICLSLLNTWHGKGNEVWSSSSSSILQVLVSIQGLVLNTKPYFNEAGYDNLVGSTEGENDSLSYNESAYLLNCKRMINLMRHPLKGFEELVREHFISRSYYILKACDAYMKGHQIGCLAKDASPIKNSKPNANSLGFERTLATKIAPKLFFALEEIGVDCRDFMYALKT